MTSHRANLYFAYGSNMRPEQMARRCPGAVELGIGRLVGHRLVFNRRGSYRPGGVASVLATGRDDDAVPGVVWQLSQAGLAALDRIEDPSAYTRHEFSISSDERPAWRCFAYTAIPQADHIPPDPAYLRILLEQSTRRGFPSAYLAYLETLR